MFDRKSDLIMLWSRGLADLRIAELASSAVRGHDRRVSSVAVNEAELRLGVSFPAHLRTVYGEADGWFRSDGAWWVVWPLDR